MSTTTKIQVSRSPIVKFSMVISCDTVLPYKSLCISLNQDKTPINGVQDENVTPFTIKQDNMRKTGAMERRVYFSVLLFSSSGTLSGLNQNAFLLLLH